MAVDEPNPDALADEQGRDFQRGHAADRPPDDGHARRKHHQPSRGAGPPRVSGPGRIVTGEQRLFELQRLNSASILLGVCVAAVVALTILRCIFISTVELRVDEAYYWTWSKENVASYLDHPPMIAWLIRLGTLAFGDTNFGVRFPGLLAMSLMQLLLGAIVWRVLRDLRYVAAVVLMTEASLAYGVGMTKVTPDVALIPCGLAMLWSLVRLAQSNDHRWWLVAGLFGGLALLAKYTAVLFAPALAAFVLIPSWRKQQMSSVYLWLGLGVAVLVFSPVLWWNAAHDWASFRFQLDRPAQIPGGTTRFLLDFAGLESGRVGIFLLPVVLVGTAMLAVRGYRERAPIPILLATAVIFPLGFWLWHGLTTRIGDSWALFIWPIAFACGAINLSVVLQRSPGSRLGWTGLILIVVSVVAGVALVATAHLYYAFGTANYLKSKDPVGMEVGFAGLAAAADASRTAVGARWLATTDYRTYSYLRWHLRDAAVTIVQVNERRRYIGFAEPALEGAVGLHVAARGDPDVTILARTGATLQVVAEVDRAWRGVTYETYLLQKLTNWKPALSLPPGDPFERAQPFPAVH